MPISQHVLVRKVVYEQQHIPHHVRKVVAKNQSISQHVRKVIINKHSTPQDDEEAVFKQQSIPQHFKEKVLKKQSVSDERHVGEPLVSIDRGTFYREHPSTLVDEKANSPLFAHLRFKIHATVNSDVGEPKRLHPHWAVIGANPTPFLSLLKGDYICSPPNARTYPHLSSADIERKDPRLRVPSRAIQYVGFNAGSGAGSGAANGVRGSYLSARYESRREETDWSLSQYLRGETELNPSEDLAEKIKDEVFFAQVVQNLRLNKLLDMPVSNLSNGQTRRSRIAKALLARPELLLLDEPFMGLDPPTLVSLSPILKDLAFKSSPLLVLGLRPQDPIPDWITNLVILGENNTFVMGKTKAVALHRMHAWSKAHRDPTSVDLDTLAMANALTEAHGPPVFDVASILTPNGIKRFSAVEEAFEIIRQNRLETGHTNPASLTHFDRIRYLKIHEKSPADRNIQDWQHYAGVLSTKAHAFLLRKMKELHQPGTSTEIEIQPIEPANPEPELSMSSQEPLIELQNIIVKYGPRTVLGHPPPQPGHTEHGLNLTISRGTRLLLLGPNGSGKTTLLSLLNSDHPHSYSLPIKFFGRTRLPEIGKPGLSLWEIQSRIGHSSPEVHAFFPKHLSIRQVLESAWSETFSSKPDLNPERSRLVDHFLRVWQAELRQIYSTTGSNAAADELAWASNKQAHPAFGRLSFGTQRLLLLLRAIIKQPDIIILDEAFSGLPTAVRDKALGWLEKGNASVVDAAKLAGGINFPGLTDRQALVVVSHVREEVPSCINEFIRLPSEEEALERQVTIQTGRSDHGQIKTVEGWNRVWGL